MTPVSPAQRVSEALSDGQTPEDRAGRLDTVSRDLGAGAAQKAFREAVSLEIDCFNRGVAASESAVVDTTFFHQRMSAVYAATSRLPLEEDCTS